ncbi:MAG TPA: glutamate-5-semialdehyde dehydrogenase [Dehalococcoidales bacterium]|nr:glutamate-5-semialdehyde dehydrogenase [Dehalococcoidales bacterium]
MSDKYGQLEEKARAAKAASKKMSGLSTETKNRALGQIAIDLVKRQDEILAANRMDYKEAEAAGLSAAMLDRLMLNQSRLEGMARDVVSVAALQDPVGEMFDTRTLPNNLLIGRKRVPLGVIGAIYESRPNVTVDISVLCLKSGNAVILRGGKETIRSNQALVKVLEEAAYQAGIPAGAIQFVENTDHALVERLLKLNKYIDLIIPRGGSGLIKFVAENASMPVVTGGIGVCHTYVDKSADVQKAVDIIYNAKVQRPTVCNALDTVLIHSEVAANCLPLIAGKLNTANVEIRCDKRALTILGNNPLLNLKKAVEEDWGKEFLALIAAVKVVDSLDDALAHIERYGSGHSESIVTEDYSAGMRFLNEVDAACVYLNASTRFTDGGQFGMGAEVGISTQKFHARGPMGLKELTTYKWIILGNGQVRPG